MKSLSKNFTREESISFWKRKLENQEKTLITLTEKQKRIEEERISLQRKIEESKQKLSLLDQLVKQDLQPSDLTVKTESKTVILKKSSIFKKPED
jgi:predicted nuclease with TOPRIM domain